MKSFKFRYNSILLLLEKKENAIKNKLNSTNNELSLLKDYHVELMNSEKNYSDVLNDKLNSGCKLNQVKNIDYYKKQIKNMILEQRKKIIKTEDEIFNIKKELIESSKEKKIMEKLKEKKHEQYLIEFKLDEEKTIDQLVTYSNSLRR